MRRLPQEGNAVTDHGPPFRNGRLDTQAQETQGRRKKNGSTYTQRHLHNDRGKAIGENVNEHDASVVDADHPRRIDVIPLADGKHNRADDARITGYTNYGYGNHGID